MCFKFKIAVSTIPYILPHFWMEYNTSIIKMVGNRLRFTNTKRVQFFNLQLTVIFKAFRTERGKIAEKGKAVLESNVENDITVLLLITFVIVGKMTFQLQFPYVKDDHGDIYLRGLFEY
jgi:hypothetical protein